MDNTQIVTIDEVEYKFDDLPYEVKHILSQIQFTRDEAYKAELEKQRAYMMQRGYVSELGDAMSRWKDEAAND